MGGSLFVFLSGAVLLVSCLLSFKNTDFYDFHVLFSLGTIISAALYAK